VNFAVKIDYIKPALRLVLDDQVNLPKESLSTMTMAQVVSLRESSVMLVVAE